MAGTLYVLTGPSGVGKTTVAHELLSKRPNLKKVVTYTTRKIRPNEADGVSYHFVTKEKFDEMLKNDEFLEWDEHYGASYGMTKKSVEELLDLGGDVLLVIDVAGARTLKEKRPEAITLFLAAESPEILIKRLEDRDKKGGSTGLEERMEAYKEEMIFCKQCEHEIVNKEGKLDETVEKILEIMN